MGCLSKEEREEVLKAFWEARKRSRRLFARRRERVRRAAAREEDPYRGRLLMWAAENWGAMETLGYGDAPGLYGTAYAALPGGLRADMEEVRVSADPGRALSAEDQERMEAQELRHAELERTGSSCPETEAKLGELNERRRLRGETRITADQLKEMHREISRASRVHDPQDLPR